MKHFIMLLLLSLFYGCNGFREVTDAELKVLMSQPRRLEEFHYIGSKDEYDYFVGEQWAVHSYPPAARQTELYYKVRDSILVVKRYPLTKDTSQWRTLKPLPTSRFVTDEKGNIITDEKGNPISFGNPIPF